MANLGRPRDGKEIKNVYTVRLEPTLKKRVDKNFDSLALLIEFCDLVVKSKNDINEIKHYMGKCDTDCTLCKKELKCL